MNRKYVIEFYALSKFNNQYYLGKCFCDTKAEVDRLIDQGKKENKKHLRTTDNLRVYVKNSDLEVIDSFTFEPKEL
jgi:hypothetical protein